MAICATGSNSEAIIGGLMLLMMASVAYADVSCSITLTNSEGATQDSISVSNANYNSASVLLPSDNWGGLPYSIWSKGSGASTSSSGKFSESVAVKGGEQPGEMDANVETQSGAFSWSKNVNIGSTTPDTSMNVNSMVSNGILDSSYSNSNSAAKKEIYTQNSKYFDRSIITPQLVFTNGGGDSLKEIRNGFSSHLEAETFGKKGVMGTGLWERFDEGADNKWYDKMVLTPEGGSMDQSLTVLSNNKCRLEDDKDGTNGQIQTGMTFTPYDTRTGSQIYETQRVPGNNAWPLCVLVIPREAQNEPSYFDFKTISMSSAWPD